MTHLLIKEMFADYEILKIIITNKDKLFISTFYKELRKSLKINEKMFITFHSQINKQIEKINQILKTYLKIYI